MTEDIPGGVYAFAAVVDHFQRRRLNPIVGQSLRTRSCGNGTLRTRRIKTRLPRLLRSEKRD
jgi:hypothetical protein